MNIRKEREGNQLNVTLSGELNTLTAAELEKALTNEVRDGDTVVFDMTDVIYITSAGIRVLLACNAATGNQGKVILRGVCDEIREVLELTGFDTVLNLE